MLGTNDNRYGRSVDAFGADLWTVVDRLRAQGVIPILSTIPPTTSDPYAAARIPLFNRVIRALAQGRSIPLVDLGDTRTGDHAVTYRLDLAAQTAVDAYVVDRGGVDVDVTIENASHAALATGDESASATAGPGTVYVTVTSHAITTDGEYLLVVEPH